MRGLINRVLGSRKVYLKVHWDLVVTLPSRVRSPAILPHENSHVVVSPNRGSLFEGPSQKVPEFLEEPQSPSPKAGISPPLFFYRDPPKKVPEVWEAPYTVGSLRGGGGPFCCLWV